MWTLVYQSATIFCIWIGPELLTLTLARGIVVPLCDDILQGFVIPRVINGNGAI